MSYFPCDIPYMSKEELKENGIRIPKDVPNTKVGGKDLIYRQEAIDALYHVDEYNGRSIKAIRNLPSAQPKIIRCKDCKYYIPYEWMFDGLSRSSNIDDYSPNEIGCSVNDHNYPPDGFCSCAERRTND